MHKRKLLTRLGSGVVVAAVTAGSLLLVSEVAGATVPTGSLGTDTLNPATGAETTPMSGTPSAPCPTGTQAVNQTIVGPVQADGTAPDATSTFPDSNPFPVTGTTSSNAAFSTRFPITLQFSGTLVDDAKLRGKTLQPGEYHVTLHCTDIIGPAGKQLGTFTGGLIFDNSLNYTVIPNASPSPVSSPSPSPGPSSVSSASPSPGPSPRPGVTVTMTMLRMIRVPLPFDLGGFVIASANVAPFNAAGTVQFNDGTTALGAPVPVSNGFALLFVGTLTSGEHSLTAVFTPTDPAAFTPSTSNTVRFGGNGGVGAKATTTKLTVIPSGTFAQRVPRLLIANVAPARVAGTVQFSDGSSALGGPVRVFHGRAVLATPTLTPGTHSLTAAFTPTDPVAFGPSESDAVPLTVAVGQTPVSPGPTSTVAGSLFQPWQRFIQSFFAGL